MPEWLLWTVIIVNLGAWLIFLLASLVDFVASFFPAKGTSIYQYEEPVDSEDPDGETRTVRCFW